LKVAAERLSAGAGNIMVFGHRLPDVDAAVSAVVFSRILRTLGLKAEPCLPGEWGRSIELLLARVPLERPRIVESVRPRARDIMTPNPLYVKRGDPLKRAVDVLTTHNIRSVPVVDEDMRVVGLFSVESYAREAIRELSGLRLQVRGVRLGTFAELANGVILSGRPEDVVEGRVFVAAMSAKRIEERAEEIRGGIVLVGDRPEVIEKLINISVAAVITTGGYVPTEDIVELARKSGVILVSVPYDTYRTARLLDLSQSVELFVEQATTVAPDTHVEEVRSLMVRRGVRSAVVVDESGRLLGIVTRSDFLKDYRKRVALVDHNEFSQSVDGVEEAVIVAVVDHHRLGGDVETERPIIFRVEPVGATATILWRMMRELGVEAERSVAEAVLYAVLTDTLLLRSATTTDLDRAVMDEALRASGLSREEAYTFARTLLAASEPEDLRQAATQDVKVYEYAGVRFAIAQVFTADPSRYLANRDEVMRILDEEASKGGYGFYALMVTDYIEGNTYLAARGMMASVVYEAFGGSEEKGFIYLKGVTSRKSEVAPKILEALKSRTT